MSKPNPQFVRLLFEKYLKQVYPGQEIAGTQFAELKNAFYAAFFSALNETMSVASALPEDQSVAFLQAVQDECEDHAKAIIDKMYRSN